MNEKFYTDLDGLLRIPSVAVDGDKEYPFGKDCADALDYMLDLCASFGMRTKKCANYLGYAEIGEGDEIVGILAHLDVVPAGSGWDYPPFALTRVTVDGEDRLIGRGVEDDKGPALICVYAMKKLLDDGVKLSRRVRIIFGLTEERGEWIDMQYYCETEELPTVGFTPDAGFPTAYGEKGIAHFALTLHDGGIDTVKGGSAANMVPDACTCEIDGKIFEAEGKSAHGSMPHLGKNAIISCMEEVNKTSPCPLSKFVTACFDERCDGSLLGCACSDEPSGDLTLNLGVVYTEGKAVTLVIDIRYPVTADFAKIAEAIEKKCDEYGVSVQLLENKAPVYFDKNGPLITALCAAFREHTGSDAEPFVMGGGTYARAMPNIVSFGPGFPGAPETAHQKNEFFLDKYTDTACKIYEDTIIRLCDVKL